MVAVAAYPSTIFTGRSTWLPPLGIAIFLLAHWPSVGATRTAASRVVFMGFFFLIAATGVNTGGNFGGQYLASAALVLTAIPVASKANPHRIARTVVLLTLAEIGLALGQFFLHVEVPWHHQEPQWMAYLTRNELLGGGRPRVDGTMGHPLLLALLVNLSFAIVVRASYVRRRRLVIMSILVAGILITGSRSAAAIALLLVLFGTVRRFTLGRLAGRALLAVGLLVLAINAGVLQSGVVDRFTASGSLSHRQGAFSSVPVLFHEQSLSYLLFGNGWAGPQTLFDRGLLQTDYFRAVDNQWVATIVSSGLVGLALISFAMYRAVRHADTDQRVLWLTFLVEWFVFDALWWTPGLLACGVLLGVRASRPEVAEHPPQQVPQQVPASPGSPTAPSLRNRRAPPEAALS
jgi:hypothetical protein